MYYEKTTITTVLTVLKGVKVQDALKEIGAEVPERKPGEKRLPPMLLQFAPPWQEAGWLETEKDQMVALIPLPTHEEDTLSEILIQGKDTPEKAKFQFG